MSVGKSVADEARLERPPLGDRAPLVVHVIHRLAVGGMENGLVNLINNMPPERYRHAVVSLTDTTEFSRRIRRSDVPIVALHKRAGNDLTTHARLWNLLREWRPSIVHTRNFPTLEYLFLAAVAGVPGRIHGEHGRDMYDLDGRKARYVLFRRTMKPFVHRYIAVSVDLASWLGTTIRVKPAQLTQIYNGVDVVRFSPAVRHQRTLWPEGFADPGCVVIGTVGRLEPVKDQVTLVRAFVRLLDDAPERRARLRLVIVGDGSLRPAAHEILRAAQAEHLAWLPGARDDIPEFLQGFDVFVLPSLREGVSNTILEAMASGLPVVATRVGGNPELVREGEDGLLTPAGDPAAMAHAIGEYVDAPLLRRRHGAAARRKVETSFSIDAMIQSYMAVYDATLERRGGSLARRTTDRPAPRLG